MKLDVFIQANTNGRLHAADEPSVSPLNRGFLYGDAVYEVWRTYKGMVFAWEEHWARMEQSLAALHMKLRWKREELLEEMRRTVRAFREKTGFAGELYIRLQVSRGCGAIGLDVKLADEMEFVVLVQKCPGLSEEQLEKGQVLSIARGLRRNPVEALNPAWKTGNYLNNLLCLREAKARGADEVLMLNLRGEVTEAAVSNVGFVRGGRVVLPALESGILEGITRGFLLGRVAELAGVEVVEAVVREEELPAMEECFLTATTKDVVPIRAIDGMNFKVGKGTVSRRVKEAFGRFMEEYLKEGRGPRV